jgi:uncharacterized iron-regulated membrane protein
VAPPQMSRHVKRLLYQLHKYLGLTAGVVLLLSALTGSLLVFGDALEWILYPELQRVEPGRAHAPLEALVAQARAAYPEGKPAFLRLPRSQSETVQVYMNADDGPRVYLDPYRATVLGIRKPHETFKGFVFALHTQLFAGKAGETVVGLAGLSLVVLALSGIVLWWSGWRRVLGSLKIRWRESWLRKCYDLHKAAGITTLLFLLVSAVTGVALVFHDTFTGILFWMTRTAEPVPPARVVVAGSALTIDEVVQRAKAALPEGRVTWLYLPMSADQPIIVRKKLPEEVHPNGCNFVYIDPYRGDILFVRPSRAVPLGIRIDNLIYPLHIGVIGGLTTQVIQVTVGLLLALLFVTALVVWVMRSRSTTRRFPAQQIWGRRPRRLAASPKP